MRRLDRLLRPRSIAVVGGGPFAPNVIAQLQRIGFDGDIWPVHPSKSEIAGNPAFSSLEALPAAPDAAFVGVNRAATIGVVAALSKMGAGGAVCYASGFSEAMAELPDGADLQAELVAAAGEMPILGPNCYGFINALDGAALWPDLHGMTRIERGVAVITQSSNLSINLTLQTRGLPLAFMIAIGNQAQTGMAEIGAALLADDRVTALGLHIEGIADLPGFIALADKAHALGKPVVVLKVGASDQAQAAMVSHTASLAGSEAGARALIQRLGFARVETPAAFLESLKLLHVTGRLASGRIASASCSGGEAALMADLGQAAGLTFPPLNPAQTPALRDALGPKVALANPLDYHTYIWGDAAATTACFKALMLGDMALGCVVLDVPDPSLFDAPGWDVTLDAIKAAATSTDTPMAVIASLPENMPTRIADALLADGIVPFCGMETAIAAIAASTAIAPASRDVLLPGAPTGERVLSEADAKAALAPFGLRIPNTVRVADPDAAVAAATQIGYPVVLKGEGVAHKTEVGAVAIDLRDAAAVRAASARIPATTFLVEEMIEKTVAELLIGVLRDPAHGFVLTLGAGGILTELMADTATILLPASRDEIRDALASLRISALFSGYRGAPAADINAILDAVEAVQAFVQANRTRLHEVEINPLMCLANGAIAADALIGLGDEE